MLEQVKALFYSTLIATILSYAFIATAALILLVWFRPRMRERVQMFSASEFILRVLYAFAAWTYGIAEGADSFLIMYREKSKLSRKYSRAEIERKNLFLRVLPALDEKKVS